MRSLIGWTIGGGWLLFARLALADEGIDPAEVEPNDAVLDGVVGASVNTTTAVAQLAATGAPLRSEGTSPLRTSSMGAPPICMPDSPRCRTFASPSGDTPAWDGGSVPRDVSGPTGIWRKKRSRGCGRSGR